MYFDGLMVGGWYELCDCGLYPKVRVTDGMLSAIAQAMLCEMERTVGCDQAMRLEEHAHAIYRRKD